MWNYKKCLRVRKYHSNYMRKNQVRKRIRKKRKSSHLMKKMTKLCINKKNNRIIIISKKINNNSNIITKMIQKYNNNNNNKITIQMRINLHRINIKRITSIITKRIKIKISKWISTVKNI